MNKIVYKYDVKYSIYYNNLLYLLKLNKEKNKQKKSDFYREIGIYYTIESAWKKGTIPAQTTLKRICDYFNKWLDISLSIDDILNTLLAEKYNSLRIVSDINQQYDYQTQRLLKKFLKLDKAGKKIILELLDRLESNAARIPE